MELKASLFDMKIVQFNSVYHNGSTGRNVEEIHRYLQEHEIDSYVFCNNYSAPQDQIFRIGNLLDHKLHGLLSRVVGLQAHFSHIPTFKVLRKVDVIKPDIVILNNSHANYLNIPMLLRYLSKHDIATIAVLHDCWYFTGHCCHYNNVSCDKWKRECGNCPSLKQWNKSLFFDNSKKMLKEKAKLFSAIPRLGVIGVSDWITNEGKQSILQNAKFKRIYNWIDLELFRPRNKIGVRKRHGFDADAFIVTSVSSYWTTEKGLDIIIKVAQMCPQALFLLIGRISETGKSQLPNNIKAEGLVSSVETLAELYSCSDVYLNCSHMETFGKVTAEAMATGLPVIVNNATANPELVGDCGYIIDNNNCSLIVEAIIDLRENGTERYTTKSVERARALFSKDNNIASYVDFAKEIIGNR